MPDVGCPNQDDISNNESSTPSTLLVEDRSKPSQAKQTKQTDRYSVSFELRSAGISGAKDLCWRITTVTKSTLLLCLTL
jgi:hypothetical protein